MADFNQIILTGRLTKDPEVQTLQSGTLLASFTIANEPFWTSDETKRRTNFIICKAFGKVAEFVQKNLYKGLHIGVSGELSLSSRKNEDGSYSNFTNVMVGEIKLFPGSFDKNRNGNGNGPADEATSFYGPEEAPAQPAASGRTTPSGRRVPGRRY